MSDSNRSNSFRSDIEGLRGIAVLIVVIFHCGITAVSGGFVGVDVFFVLSGYLITGLLVNEIQAKGRLSLTNFYARRARRLLPASALVLIATLVVGGLILAPHEISFAARAARATAVYLSNLFFALNGADYFAADVKSNPMLHTWSLAVEEQFYIFWPLLIALGLRFLGSLRGLASLLVLLTAVSFYISISETRSTSTFAFYGLPARAWEFGIGGLAGLLSTTSLRLPRPAWLILGWLGLATIAGSATLISERDPFPGWLAAAPVLGTTLSLLASAEMPHAGAARLLDSRPLQFLGKLSYSWYLWHWPALVLAAALIPEISVFGKLAAAVFALGIAALSHRYVENPIRFHPALVRQPATSLYLALAITVGSVAASFLAIRAATGLGTRPDMATFSAASTDVGRFPRSDCMSQRTSSAVIACSFGDTTSATKVVLFGDSHAIQWFNPIQRIAESRRWHLTTFMRNACPATTIEHFGSLGGQKNNVRNCNAWRDEAVKRINRMQPSLVILGNATIYLGRQESRRPGINASLEEWRSGTTQTLRALIAPGRTIVSIRDNPLFKVDVPTCLARSARHRWYPGGSCETARAGALDPAIFAAEQTAAQGLFGVHFVDLTEQFCSDVTCWATRNGQVLYRDEGHLTGEFAERLRPLMEARLLAAMDSVGRPRAGP